MKLVGTFLDKVKIFKNPKFEDERGYFSIIYNDSCKNVLNESFIQVNSAYSKHINTVRGLHFQNPPFEQGKLIWVAQGKIIDVFVDIEKKSKNFGKHDSVILSAEDNHSLYVPPRFAHGYCTLEPNTIVYYMVTNAYSPLHEGSILWNDPFLEIKWPMLEDRAILSEKDKESPIFAHAKIY